LYYNLPSDVRIMGGFNFGSGTTVYQGENRFRLDDIFFWQGKMEVSKKDKFFLRAYITEEDAGKSYDAYATALQLQNAAKTLDDFNVDYTQYWQSINTPKVRKLEGYPSPWNYNQYLEVLAMNPDSLFKWHAATQAYANQKVKQDISVPFFEPGTARFDSMFAIITGNYGNDPDQPGTRFYDRSGLIHVHGEYKIPSNFADFTLGANFRQYNPDSRGTIFSDTSGTVIRNSEFGVYGGLTKKLIPARLKLNATLRMDKNQNFDYLFSPAASFVYTPNTRNTFRVSFSSAIRNPTLSDQYLYFDVGRATLLGNISGYTDLITPESFVDYLNTLQTDTLVYFDESPIRPEKVKSVELGYRGSLGDNLWIDAGYYYSFYTDFIGYKIAITSEFFPGTPFPVNPQVYRISTNAASTVTTQGFSAGGNYFLGEYYTVSGNYSWNVLNKQGTDDPIIPAFNTPEHKFNLGFSARNLPLNLFGARSNSFGFSVNYKWIEGFVFEGSPQFTGAIPTYDLVDAQVNWTAQKLGLTIKAGATNLLDKRQYQTYGGPAIGRLAYISFLYESKT
jgi:iron complex outermembrane receptor protein